jgi:diguanylate cyclase (GGDEF)-like protein
MPFEKDLKNQRRTERRTGNDRREHSSSQRRHRDRRSTCYATSWQDQKIQFFTRYLFCLIGVIYFNLGFEYQAQWLTLSQMNGFFAAYMTWNTVLFIHGSLFHHSSERIRISMWGDIMGISLVVLTDPYIVPLTAMVYIVIVLGNGMRYGMRCFSEALAGSFIFGSITLLMRYVDSVYNLMPGVIFLALFGGLILVYAYMLMSRVEASHNALHKNSRIDPLTVLLNRAALQEEAQHLFEEAKRLNEKLMVVFADLDRFKSVNDNHGHAEGDRVLCSIARIIQSSIRDQDIAARYGGDEFVLLLYGIEPDAAKSVCDRIQTRLEEWVSRQDYDVGISMGLGQAIKHGHDLDEILDKVDEALYACKNDNDLSVVTLNA